MPINYTTTPSTGLVIIIQGDTFRTEWAYIDPEKNPIDLSGVSVSFVAKSHDTSLTLSSDDSAISVDAVRGTVSVDLSPAETSQLNPGRFLCQQRITFSNGDVLSTTALALHVKESLV